MDDGAGLIPFPGTAIGIDRAIFSPDFFSAWLAGVVVRSHPRSVGVDAGIALAAAIVIGMVECGSIGLERRHSHQITLTVVTVGMDGHIIGKTSLGTTGLGTGGLYIDGRCVFRTTLDPGYSFRTSGLFTWQITAHTLRK